MLYRSRAVAAASRLIEAATNPAFAQCFDPTIPGNLDPKALLVYTAEKSGLPMENFLITRETAQKNLRARMEAQGIPQPGGQQPQAPGMPPAAPAPGELPMPSAEPPQATGAVLQAPQL